MVLCCVIFSTNAASSKIKIHFLPHGLIDDARLPWLSGFCMFLRAKILRLIELREADWRASSTAAFKGSTLLKILLASALQCHSSGDRCLLLSKFAISSWTKQKKLQISIFSNEFAITEVEFLVNPKRIAELIRNLGALIVWSSTKFDCLRD